MALSLRVTDYQFAVIERMRVARGEITLSELAEAAVAYETARAPEVRRPFQRPMQRPVSPPRGEPHLDALLPAASSVAFGLAAGQRLRIEQVKDGQGVDLCVHGPDGHTFSAARTRSRHGINPTTGDSLWSTAPEARLMTIVEDSAPGHDLCFPPCSEAEYHEHTGIPGHVGCSELLAAAQTHRPGGSRWEPGDNVLNLWLASAVDGDGRLQSWPASCRRGDYVVLEADTDVVVTLSTCPDDLFGTTQYEPGPVRVIVDDGPSVPPLSWPGAPPASALATNHLTVTVPPPALSQLEAIAANGWLGFTSSEVLRAVILRLYEAERAGADGHVAA
ncbi:MAG TPA: urea carboxylase-associated family protein [Solirubrobacteraceae bacterium]|nr:urea carboxylase-associated family protein [Solirubrobacteraceae bacterium]